MQRENTCTNMVFCFCRPLIIFENKVIIHIQIITTTHMGQLFNLLQISFYFIDI